MVKGSWNIRDQVLDDTYSKLDKLSLTKKIKK